MSTGVDHVKKYLVIPIFLIFGFFCGWVNEGGTEQHVMYTESETVICGEIRWSMVEECQPCVIMRGCDGEQYRLFIPAAPRCKYVKIVNPVWGDAQIQCPVEGGEVGGSYRTVRAHCIMEYTSIECLDSCAECSDPCADVHCSPECSGCNLWATKCVDGECVQDYIAATNSEECGCGGGPCGTVCVGMDLWSQKRANGECVYDKLVEPNSTACGFNPCENHCYNGQKDCQEYGVDCGGGCPFTDSDSDGVEDCMDQCQNSRCNRVDARGCETDVDNDGVKDCDDECPQEEGDPSNRGCPNSALPLVVGIGAAAAVAGGLAFKGIKGGKLARDLSKPLSEDIAARKEAAERIAKEIAEKVAQEAESKIAEAGSEKIGTKLAEAGSEKIGTKLAEAGSEKIGTKLAEAGSEKIGIKLAEAGSEKIGTKLAETTIGAGITGAVAKQKSIISCPHCGEKLPSDSEFCSKCGHAL
jgi:hypothetical protein